jgi:endo-1,3(4)-beta-glucanase
MEATAKAINGALVRCRYGIRIHMISLNPSSTVILTRNFVRKEWQWYFDNGRMGQINNSFKGILYAHLAITDPASAWNFFSQSNFQR